jgi:hypothetical protein
MEDWIDTKEILTTSTRGSDFRGDQKPEHAMDSRVFDRRVFCSGKFPLGSSLVRYGGKSHLVSVEDKFKEPRVEIVDENIDERRKKVKYHFTF